MSAAANERSGVTAMMGAALDHELQERGVFSLGRSDCEQIILRVLERSAAAADQALAQTNGNSNNQ